jgi:hypothetical protein
MLSHLFRTCKQIDAEFYGGKSFLEKAAKKVFTPIYRSSVPIDQALNEIFEVDSFITAIRPALREVLTGSTQITSPDTDYFKAIK